MKPNIFLFDLPKNGKTICYVEKKSSYIRQFSRIRQTRKCLLSRRNGKRQPANVKNAGKIIVTWSLLPFAFHVNVIPNFSIISAFLSEFLRFYADLHFTGYPVVSLDLRYLARFVEFLQSLSNKLL